MSNSTVCSTSSARRWDIRNKYGTNKCQRKWAHTMLGESWAEERVSSVRREEPPPPALALRCHSAETRQRERLCCQTPHRNEQLRFHPIPFLSLAHVRPRPPRDNSIHPPTDPFRRTRSPPKDCGTTRVTRGTKARYHHRTPLEGLYRRDQTHVLHAAHSSLILLTTSTASTGQ
jgi:hypothetical protein